MDEQNRGCRIEPGTLVCSIVSRNGDITDLPERPEGCFAQISNVPLSALAVVDQDSVALVQPGQLVRVRIDSLPGEVYEGRVVEIASRDLKVVPRELASGADLPGAQSIARESPARPLLPIRCSVRLTRQPETIVAGSRGEAKFFVESQSLAARLYRALAAECYARLVRTWPEATSRFVRINDAVFSLLSAALPHHRRADSTAENSGPLSFTTAAAS